MKSTITIITNQYCIIVVRFTTTYSKINNSSNYQWVRLWLYYLLHDLQSVHCQLYFCITIVIDGVKFIHAMKKGSIEVQLRCNWWSFEVMSLTWVMVLLTIRTYQKQIKPLLTRLWRLVAQNTFLKTDFHKNSFYIINI